MSLPGYLIEAHLGDVRFSRHHDWTPEPVQYAVASETTADLSNNRETGIVRLRAEIAWHRPDDDEPIEGPFELAVTVVGTFAWTQPDETDEDIKGWLEFNSQHLLWPYLRGYVTTITAISGLPPLTIFTISVPNPVLGEQAPTGHELPTE